MSLSLSESPGVELGVVSEESTSIEGVESEGREGIGVVAVRCFSFAALTLALHSPSRMPGRLLESMNAFPWYCGVSQSAMADQSPAWTSSAFDAALSRMPCAKWRLRRSASIRGDG